MHVKRPSLANRRCAIEAPASGVARRSRARQRLLSEGAAWPWNGKELLRMSSVTSWNRPTPNGPFPHGT